MYARWSILTFFKNKASVPIFWLKGHVISGFRPFLGSLMKNWLSAPGLSVHTRFRHIADPRKSIKSNISRTTGRIKLADPSFEAECPWIYCKFSYLKPMNRLSCPKMSSYLFFPWNKTQFPFYTKFQAYFWLKKAL